MIRTLSLLFTASLAACASVDERPLTDLSVPSVTAKVETEAVKSSDDAADDPAIYINAADPSQSLILGTDKQAGLYVYGLDGAVKQFLPSGRLNNVDLRQGGDVALMVASNRSDDSVVIFALEDGVVAETGRFSAIRPEPYGICMALLPTGGALAAVTHKGGEVDLYQFSSLDGGNARHVQTLELGSQLEGCVFDEENNTFFVGNEETGIFRYAMDDQGQFVDNPYTVDLVGGETGVAADVEGLALYKGPTSQDGFLIASSQGNNTYAVYSRNGEAFLGRFRIASDAATGIDGTEETDGLDITSASLPGYPGGLLVVQDGFNDPGDKQNFKLVSWDEVAAALGL